MKEEAKKKRGRMNAIIIMGWKDQERSLRKKSSQIIEGKKKIKEEEIGMKE